MNTDEQSVVLNPEHQKGVESQLAGQKALLLMKKHGRGIRELKTPPVVDVICPKQYSRLDHHGVDLVAVLEDGHQIPFSLKSSVRGTKNFKRRHKMRWTKGWFTALTEALLVRATDRPRAIIKMFAEYMNRMYTVVRRETNKIRCWRKSQCRRRHGRVPNRGTFVRQICFAT
jgi:hypothetical protein